MASPVAVGPDTFLIPRVAPAGDADVPVSSLLIGVRALASDAPVVPSGQSTLDLLLADRR